MAETANKKYDLWFSQKQRDDDEEKRFGKLEDGSIIEYTEAVSAGEKPSGCWDDYVFLGRGYYDHSEPIEAVKH